MRVLERNLGVIAVALLLAVAIPSKSFAESGVTILAHDLVQDPIVSIAEKTTTGPNAVPSRNRIVSFSAFGNRYILDLQPNDRLIAGVLPVLSQAGNVPGVYQGMLSSRPDTWARIAIDQSGNISGVIWDGAELIVLDQAARLYGNLSTTGGVDRTLAIKGSDIRIKIDDGVGGGGSSQTRGIDELYEAASARASEGAVSRAISIGLVLDDDYVGLAKTQAIQRSIELTNIADGIFVSQVAVHLNIGFIRAFDRDTPDPFSSAEPGTLLDQLVDLKESDPALTPMGLVHLFTRTNLDGDTRGIARLSSYCGPDKGAGLTEGRGSTVDALIMAHEIGHNFGARHDGVTGEGCASTPQTFLMAPEISGSSVFSPCSVDKMSQTLNAVSCLANVPTSEISIAQPIVPSAVLYGEKHFFEYVITNEGLESTLDSSLSVSTEDAVEIQSNGSPDRDCGHAGPQHSHSCDLQSLHAGESVKVGIAFLAKQVGDIHIDGLASASNDTNPSNNAVRSTVRVVEATDLMPSGNEILPGGAHIKPGQSVDYRVDVSNRGDFASEATVTISTTYNHSLSSADACSSINDFTLRCELGDLPAGTVSSIGFVAHSDGSLAIDPTESKLGEITVHVDSSIADFAPQNDRAQLRFVMWGTIKDLYSRFTEPPVSMEQGESAAISGVFGNSGPDAAANVSAQIEISPVGLKIDELTIEQGTCERMGAARFDCEIGTLEPDETVAVSATYTGTTAGDYRFQIDAHENFNGHEANQEDNFDFALISVTAPAPLPPAESPVSSAGTAKSGGGGLTWALMYTLLLALRRLYDRTILFRDRAYVGTKLPHQLARPGLRPSL